MSFCNRWIAPLWLVGLLTLGFSHAAMAQSRTEKVIFPKGFTSTVLDDTVYGRETADYTIEAKAGQRLSVSMISDSPSVSFDVFLMGSTSADFVGELSGGSYSSRLRKSGTQLIRVHLDQVTARRGEEVGFRLTISVTGTPTQPAPAPAPAPAPPEKAFWEVSGLRPNDTLNMRSGPGTSFRVLDMIPNGTVLRNFGCALNESGATWCEVSRTARGSQSGWVSSRFLIALGEVPPAPKPAPAPLPSQTTSVQCSVLIPLFDRRCEAKAVYDGRSVKLSLSIPGKSGKRNLLLKDNSFSSPDGEQIDVQVLGAQYFIVVGSGDYYLLPASLMTKK